MPAREPDFSRSYNSAELSMTSEPAVPGASAIILYRQVDRDDGKGGHEDEYRRIEIFTDEGRKYADIEIPFVKEVFEVGDIHARSIAPDGTITNYEGKPLEKTIIKAKGLRILAKVLTLPNVQKGSIVEFYYRTNFRSDYAIYIGSHWILSEELFTKDARFSLKSYNPPYEKITLHWSWRGRPEPHLLLKDPTKLSGWRLTTFQPFRSRTSCLRKMN